MVSSWMLQAFVLHFSSLTIFIDSKGSKNEATGFSNRFLFFGVRATALV